MNPKEYEEEYAKNNTLAMKVKIPREGKHLYATQTFRTMEGFYYTAYYSRPYGESEIMLLDSVRRQN